MNPIQPWVLRISLALRKETNFSKNFGSFQGNAHQEKINEKELLDAGFPPNEPPKPSKKPIFTGFSTEMNPKSILGDPLGLNWVHFRATFGGTPPFLRTPRSRSGQKFQKTATFRTSQIPKKKLGSFQGNTFRYWVHLRNFRATSEFSINSLGSFLGQHPVYIYIYLSLSLPLFVSVCLPVSMQRCIFGFVQ